MAIPPRGLENTTFPALEQRINIVLALLEEWELVVTYMRNHLYGNEVVMYSPNQQKVERNAEIKRRFANGTSASTLANQFGISVQRIHQIIHDKRK